ncbi:MAG: hypothetical protein WD773_04935 [Gemmatimonadales bacterium]
MIYLHNLLPISSRATRTRARAPARFAVLLLADLAAFAILRELYGSVGEGELLGEPG